MPIQSTHLLKIMGGLIMCAACSQPTPLPITRTLPPPPLAATATFLHPTHSPTVSATLTPTAYATPAITWTPLPTLPPATAQAKVLELLANNAGCRLPCWWGLIPGQTDWQTAQQYLGPFVRWLGPGGTGWITKDGETFFATSYSAFYRLPNEEFDSSTTFDIRNGIINQIIIVPTGLAQYYSLPKMLEAYGQPSAVYISTLKYVPNMAPPFIIGLYYTEMSTMVQYDYQADNSGDTLRVCPTPRGPKLYLWSLEQKLTPAYWHLGDPAENSRTIEEATGMTLQSFYETFKASNSQACLETAKDLWQP